MPCAQLEGRRADRLERISIQAIIYTLRGGQKTNHDFNSQWSGHRGARG
jgi:hypothetical protein